MRARGWWPGWRTVAELVRAPAALTVPGDSLAGAAAAGHPLGAGSVLTGASSVCLYWAGMALNDFADRYLDAYERPERPIPSGRVEPAAALLLATGLTGAGLTLAALTEDRRAFPLAVPLAATIWAYDFGAKHHPVIGPATMALARSLDVLMGAGPAHLRAAAPTAAVIGAHTLVVTALSRHEATGTDRNLLPPCVAATAATAVTATHLWPQDQQAGGQPAAGRAVARTAARAYLVSFLGAQLGAAGGEPRRLQEAVAAGIAALLPLQAACAAGAGAAPVAVALLGLHASTGRLFRRASPT